MTSFAPARPRSVGGRVLRAAAALTTPLLPQDYLGLVDPLLGTRDLRGRVERVVPETEDSATLVIRAGWGWRPHRAGQWVTVGVRIDGVWHCRAYSVSSAAGAERRFAVTVKAQPGGRVSPHLVHATGPGTVVRLAAPQGQFVLPEEVPGRLLFLSAGSGITPVMGMLRTLARRVSAPEVVHVHLERGPDDVIFGAELRALARREPWYRLHEHHTGRDGRPGLDELVERCPRWRDSPAWVCGPAGLLADAEAHWADAGAGERLRVERFQPRLFAAPDADGGPVSFTGSAREAQAPAGTPLLEVGEDAGVAMPSGCRMGICFSCVARLRCGQVRDLRTGEVHGDEGELIQTCVSGAAGPCAIEL